MKINSENININEEFDFNADLREIEALSPDNKQDVMVDIMNDFHSGNPDKQQYAKERMLTEMYGAIGFMINKYFSAFKKDYYDDLFQEGALGVLLNMHKFNPAAGKASTYFTTHIIHHMSGFINAETNKSTAYYSGIMNNIKKAIKFYETRNHTPSVSDIAYKTGLSVKKVEDGLLRIEASKEHCYESEAELDGLVKQHASTPEDELLKKEEEAVLNSALNNSLLLEDRELVELYFGITVDAPMSYNNIARLKGIPVKDVQKRIARSLRILSDNEDLVHLFGTTRKKRKEGIINTQEIHLVPSKVLDVMSDELDEIFNDGDFSSDDIFTAGSILVDKDIFAEDSIFEHMDKALREEFFGFKMNEQNK